jgi:hypothetical protein
MLRGGGERLLDEMTPADVENFETDRLTVLSPVTINHDLAVLKRHCTLILKRPSPNPLPPQKWASLLAAANDGTPRSNGPGDRTRTGNLRLMNRAEGA